MNNEKIIDAITGEETIREFTAEEIAKRESEAAEIEARQAIKLAAQKAKEEARKQVLDSLGITEEQFRVLFE
jgi:hypothetical protein